jgi:OOP family OmpA-OmpF porin
MRPNDREAGLAKGKRAKNNALGAGVGASAAIAAALTSLALVIALSEPSASAAGPQWSREVSRALGGKGYDWIVIDVADRVAIVSGLAPDIDSRRYGFEAAAEALRDSADEDVRLVVDATRMEEGEQGPGVALAVLGESPDKESCQKAFDETLKLRPIRFEPDGDRIASDDATLLDALAGVVLRCHAFPTEVQGHTEIAGAPARNRQLSERRAGMVVDELVNRGADRAHLSAAGFGAQRPLVRASTAAANAQNNRIEIALKP